MRLLHLTQDLAAGGAQRQLSYLAPALADMGHEVHVAFVDGGPNLSRLEASGAVLHHIGRGSRQVSRGRGWHNYDPRVLPRLSALIRKIEPDLAQTWIQHMDIFGGPACRWAGVPWILREPGSAIAYPKSLKTLARIAIAQAASLVVVNSAEGERSWIRQAAKVPRVLIPNGVPVDEIEKTKPAPFAETGILFAGRFEECKNLPKLVPALFEVLRNWPGSAACLCGRGPELEWVRVRAEKEGMAGRMLLPGVVTDLWAKLRSAAAFVSVSLYEGCPNAVLEAMAAGCPLVVSDIPAHRALLDDQSAWFVDPGDSAAIACAILSAVSCRAEASRRAECAKALVPAFSVPAMAHRYDEVYRGLAKGAACL